jgi:hypothetical protein
MATMALEFSCRSCGNKIVIRFLKAGEEAECKHCRAKNVVPDPAQARSIDTPPPGSIPIAKPPGEPEEELVFTGPKDNDAPPPPPDLKAEFSLNYALDTAMAAYGKYAGTIILVVLLEGLINAGIQMIPLLGPMAAMAIMPVIQLSLIRFYLNVMRGHRPEVKDMFFGFSRFPACHGAYWLMALICVITMIPFIAGIIGALVLKEFWTTMPYPDFILAANIIAGAVISIILFVYAAVLRWTFAFHFMMDNNCKSVLDAFHRSSVVTQGIRWRLLWYLFVISLIGLSGIILCIIGAAFFTVPVATIAVAALYDSLRKRLPPEETSEPGEPAE